MAGGVKIDGSLAIVGLQNTMLKKFHDLEFVLPLKLTLTFQDD